MPGAGKALSPADPQQQNLDLPRLSFIHTSFASICLPRSRLENDRRYHYSYDGAHIEIQAGSLFDGSEFVEQIIPYGISARLILAYLHTYAVRFETRVIPLCKNVSSFVSEIRGVTSGGPRGTIAPVVEQLKALISCKMTLGTNYRQGTRVLSRTTYMQFANAMDGFLQGDGSILWPEAVELRQDYYDSILQHSMPLDLRAIKQVARSAMAIDILYFLVGRLPRLKTMTTLTWPTIRAQFGGQDQDPKSFRRFFIAQLKQVKEAYPDANVDPTAQGLVLRPSQPMIPKTTWVIPRNSGIALSHS